MTRSIYHYFLPVASLALCSSLVFAQQSPAPPVPPSDPTAPAAPVERRPPMPPRFAADMRGRNFQPHEMGQNHDMAETLHGRMGADIHGGLGGMWWKNPTVVQRLTLTPDQVKRMDNIFQTSRLQLIDLRANVQKQEILLEPMLGANPPDTAKAMAQIDKVADARADLEKSNAKMLLGIRGVLTPDQWTKLHERRAMAEPGDQRGPGGPGGGRGRGPQPGAMDHLVQPDIEP